MLPPQVVRCQTLLLQSLLHSKSVFFLFGRDVLSFDVPWCLRIPNSMLCFVCCLFSCQNTQNTRSAPFLLSFFSPTQTLAPFPRLVSNASPMGSAAARFYLPPGTRMRCARHVLSSEDIDGALWKHLGLSILVWLPSCPSPIVSS